MSESKLEDRAAIHDLFTRYFCFGCWQGLRFGADALALLGFDGDVRHVAGC